VCKIPKFSHRDRRYNKLASVGGNLYASSGESVYVAHFSDDFENDHSIIFEHLC
jgi:hypothetical protein